MNILILGGGGREHSIAWAVLQNPKCDRLIVAPGNAGIAEIAECASLDILDGGAVAGFCEAEAVDFVIIGPEAPLAAGVADRLREAGVLVFGPSQAAARLEASKSFTKSVCATAGAPTAAYGHFIDLAAARDYVRTQGAPIVVKADGLAAGKGVIVAETTDAALAALDEMFGGTFGTAGAEVVIEEFMTGEEASFFVLCDGETALPIGTAQDHKRVGEGDTGPNTGGMGAYSPAPVVTPELHARILREVIRPVVQGMKQEGTPYTGFLYAGVMIAPDGRLGVLEFNCRFGDPETQPIMLRLKSDFTVLIEAAIDGRLDQVEAEWDRRVALGVVLAAAGYPGSPRKGDAVTGLGIKGDDFHIFHAGTAIQDDQVVVSGGRVLCVTALGDTVKIAQARAYEVAEQINFAGRQMRRDIGWRALKRR